MINYLFILHRIRMMIVFKSILYLFLLILPSTIVLSQTVSSYTAYEVSFPYVRTCQSNQYYDIALLQCSACPSNAVQKSSGNRF
jgi:hypothetical protein